MSLSRIRIDRVRITILHDTCAKYFIARNGVLPFSDHSCCGSDLFVWGIGLSVLRVPVHTIHLDSALVSCPVRVGVRDQLPVSWVDLILWNDLAGKEVFPKVPEVTEILTVDTNVFSPTDFLILPFW